MNRIHVQTVKFDKLRGVQRSRSLNDKVRKVDKERLAKKPG